MVRGVQVTLGYVQLLVIMTLVVMMTTGVVSGQEPVIPPGSDCGGRALEDLMNKCQLLEMKIEEDVSPTKECCIALQNANIPIICSCFGRIERDIILQKLTYIAQQCGRPLPPGTKC